DVVNEIEMREHRGVRHRKRYDCSLPKSAFRRNDQLRNKTMANQNLSRRSFSKFLAAGAACATVLSRDEVRASLRFPGATPIVRLSSNENPYGPSPAALKAMTDGFSLAWRYPDEYGDMLADELARLHSVPVDQILLGDGSGEILKLSAAAFTSKDKKIVVANPTFEAVARHAAVAGGDVMKIDLAS